MLLWFAHTCAADGKVWGTADTTMPAQQAIIQFSEGKQVMVIETSFEGEGTNFAWVIPVPSEPVVEEVPGWVFDALVNSYSLKVTRVKPDQFFAIIIGGGWLVFVLLGSRRFRRRDGANVLATIVALMLLIIVTDRFRPRAGLSAGADLVSVHSVFESGDFSIKVASSNEPERMVNWLQEDGFEVSPEAQKVIGDYVKEGWFFVTSKLRDQVGQKGTRKLPALKMSFATDRPIYPMRLTGLQETDLELRLFCFGESGFDVEGMKTVTCRKPRYPEMGEAPEFYRRSWGGIVNPELREVVGESSVMTVLQGVFSPEGMSQDLRLNQTKYRSFHLPVMGKRELVLKTIEYVFLLLVYPITIILWLCLGRSKRIVAIGCVLSLIITLVVILRLHHYVRILESSSDNEEELNRGALLRDLRSNLIEPENSTFEQIEERFDDLCVDSKITQGLITEDYGSLVPLSAWVRRVEDGEREFVFYDYRMFPYATNRFGEGED